MTVSPEGRHLVVVAAAEAVTTEALLEVAVGLLLLRVVLVVATVVLVVELLGVLPSLTLGLLAVDEVGALGLGKAVDLAASETGEELLCESVGNGLAYQKRQWIVARERGLWCCLTLLPLPVLEHLHGHERCTAGEQLVAELGLVVILLVDLVVIVLGVALELLDLEGIIEAVSSLTETEHCD